MACKEKQPPPFFFVDHDQNPACVIADIAFLVSKGERGHRTWEGVVSVWRAIEKPVKAVSGSISVEVCNLDFGKTDNCALARWLLYRPACVSFISWFRIGEKEPK